MRSEPRTPLRVVVTGAESTGKTTLARKLATHFNGIYVPEYLRNFVDEKGRPPYQHDVDLLVSGFESAHLRALEAKNSIVVYDTDLISTVLYQRYYFKICPQRVLDASVRYQADIYLVTDRDIPWEADPGQREGEATRDFLQQEFLNELERRHIDYTVVSGSLTERLADAVDIISSHPEFAPEE